MRYSRKRTYRKRPYKRYYKPSKAFKRNVKRVINSIAEKKYYGLTYDAATDPNGVTMLSTPSIIDISGVTQGDADWSRDGDQLYVRSMLVRYTIRLDSSLPVGQGNSCRVIVFQWYPATTPTYQEILSQAYLPSNPQYLAPYTHDGRTQFRILYDKIVTVSASRSVKPFHGQLITKIPHRKIQYRGGSTLGENKIYLMHMSDAGSLQPGLKWLTRMNFTDM